MIKRPTDKAIKLSDKQKEVIRLMRKGWELGHSKGLYTSTWLQKNGIGCGGESMRISSATFNKLYKGGFIYVHKSGYPTDKYRLNIVGKNLQID